MQSPGCFFLYLLLSCSVLGFPLLVPLLNLHVIVGVKCFLSLLLVTLENRINFHFPNVMHDGLLHTFLLVPERFEYAYAVLSLLDLTSRCFSLHQVVCVLVETPYHLGSVLFVLFLKGLLGFPLRLLSKSCFSLDH